MKLRSFNKFGGVVLIAVLLFGALTYVLVYDWNREQGTLERRVLVHDIVQYKLAQGKWPARLKDVSMVGNQLIGRYRYRAESLGYNLTEVTLDKGPSKGTCEFLAYLRNGELEIYAK